MISRNRKLIGREVRYVDPDHPQFGKITKIRTFLNQPNTPSNIVFLEDGGTVLAKQIELLPKKKFEDPKPVPHTCGYRINYPYDLIPDEVKENCLGCISRYYRIEKQRRRRAIAFAHARLPSLQNYDRDFS